MAIYLMPHVRGTHLPHKVREELVKAPMRRVDALGTQSPGGDGFGEGVYHTVLASWLVTAKDQVHSGGDGADGRLAYLAAAELGDRIHFEAVAYHHALEAELVPEEARDRRLAHRRGYAGVERFKDHCARAKAHAGVRGESN